MASFGNKLTIDFNSSFDLHMAGLSPRPEKEERPDQRQHQGRFPNGGPAPAAHERVPRQFYEIARGDEGGNPPDARRDVRDGENKSREQEREQKLHARDRLNRRRLIGNRNADHHAEADVAEQIKDRAHQQRRRVARDLQIEQRDGDQERQRPFGQGDDEEGRGLAQQKLVRRNARHINLQDRLLLAFTRYSQRRQQWREEGQDDGERPGADKFSGRPAGVVPHSRLGLDHRLAGRAVRRAYLRREGAGKRRRLTAHIVRRIGVNSVNQPLRFGLPAAQEISLEMYWYHNDRARPLGHQRFVRPPFQRERLDAKRQ